MSRRVLAVGLLLLGVSCGRHLSPPGAGWGEVSAQVEDDAPEAFASIVRVFERVLTVGDRLRTANTRECDEKVGPDLGWIAWADRDFEGHRMRELARDFLKVRRQPVVVALAPDGAAARAGVRVGDRVLEVGGESVSNSAEVMRAEAGLALAGAATIAVERDGRELELAVQPASACSQPVVLVDAPDIFAIPAQGAIGVTFRLVDVATDDELAFEIAYALAMDLLQIDPLRVTQIAPEPETTRLAVALSQRAGFSVDDVEGLLERQAIEYPEMVMAARPRNGKVGEIPRRIVALRMVRASSPAATHAAP